MKKYEITKEQVQDIYNDGCTYVKEWFPEVFKTELEVGKWYTPLNEYEGKAIVFITNPLNKSNVGFGIDYKGIWENKYDISGGSGHRESTKQEVFEALKNEAVKRGYMGNHISLIEGFLGSNSVELIGEYVYESNKNRLVVDLYGCVYTVYKDGQWAEIITTLTKKEAEEKLNCKII